MSALTTLDEQLSPRPWKAKEPELLHAYFEAQVRARPEQVAVEFGNEVLTYGELDAYANQVAHTLGSRGVRQGDLVAIYLKKSPRLYATMLGILKAGAGYVPIDGRFPLERIRAILEDSGARVIATELPLAADIDGQVETPILRLDLERQDIAAQPETPLTFDTEIDPATLSYVIYTSGSTGRPKGVMIEHSNAVAFVRTLKSVYRITADDRIYQGFSTAFDASVEEIWAAFSRGGTLVVPTEDVERSPSDVAEFINTRAITYFSTVPTMLSMIDRELPSVRTLVLGGEACSNELVSRWAKRGRRMLNTYGPTEATVVATWAECVPGEPVTIGRALPQYSAYVLDEYLSLVAAGESGELFIGGPAVARGYLNRTDLTDERFIANPFGPGRLYKTSDHVRLDETGDLYFLGRLDDQVKIRGFRIELSEIEAQLTEHPAIKAAAVRVVDTKDLKELAAYVVCDGAADSLDRKELADMLRERLPSYMVPQYLDVLDELPMTTSGKIDRKALPSPEKLFLDVGAIVPPASTLEQQIAEAWQQTFRLAEVSVEADFFIDLGGHSLTASQTATEMRKSTGSTCVSVRDIYQHRTIRALAAHIMTVEPNLGRTQGTDATGTEKTDAQSAGIAAFESVPPLTRWTVATIQAAVSILYFGLYASPLAYTVLMVTAVVDGKIDWTVAAAITTAIGFAAWPCMLLTSIAVKWLVIGRFKAGRYPVWSFYYLRWWIASRFQALSWSKMFTGTPLMALYFRAMGAKVGRNVTINSQICTAFDMISIGDNTSIGLETQMLGYRVEDGHLIIAPVTIGDDCFVGMHCALGLGTRMGDGARLDDMSLLPDGVAVPAGESRRGVPAVPAEVTVPAGDASSAQVATKGMRFMLGLTHLSLFYAMAYFLIATSIPSTAMIIAGLLLGGPIGGTVAAFASVPVWILSYALGVIIAKRLIGPVDSGTVSLGSVDYFRHWFVSFLLDNTKTILLPVYATVYLPPFLRALGAKIGRGTEISTVSHINPDELTIGSGSFLADACLVGGERIHNGVAETQHVSIGDKSFIGNSALVSGGHTIGNDVLIGVASTPPENTAVVPDGTRWLGAPGFALPTTQRTGGFSESEIFAPTLAMKVERTITDTFRILIPGFISMTCAVLLTAFLVIGYRAMSLTSVMIAVPFVASGLAWLAIKLSALVKNTLIGAHEPIVKPLWSRYVWRNELVNGVYETIAATAMAPLMGTPFIAPCLRLMGCKIGKWCFIESTLFSEFDLVEIGDRAAINVGATIQTHLFEDRVFKSDRLVIGDDCTLGNMAVILYSTEMHHGASLGPLSVLMKGESLSSNTRWHGIPCERVMTPSPASVEMELDAAVEATIEVTYYPPAPSGHGKVQKRVLATSSQ